MAKKAKILGDYQDYAVFQWKGVNEGYPIFVVFKKDQFSNQLGPFLETLSFRPSELPDSKGIREYAQRGESVRLLVLELAGPNISRQIKQFKYLDDYGPESVWASGHHYSYRYKNHALMIFGQSYLEWKIGLYEEFGREDLAEEARIIINRYLSWALISHGVVGLWGHCSHHRGLVLNMSQSEGRAFFVDLKNKRIISESKWSPLGVELELIRLDSTLAYSERQMTNEELYSFLVHHCTYLRYGTNSRFVEIQLRNLALSCVGKICSNDSLKSLDLSA